MNEKVFFTRREAADRLLNRYGVKRTSSTLAKLASIGGGPEMIYVGKAPRYTDQALARFAAALTSPPVRSTSEFRVVHEAARRAA